MEDLEFVRRLVQKDKRSWEQFVDKYSRLIYSCIHSVLRLKGLSGVKPDIIDDLFQEIFLLLTRDNCRKLGSFKAKDGCRFSSWLHQVAVNHVLDFVRSHKPILSLDSQDEEGNSLSDTIKDTGASVKELIIDKERLKDLEDCINLLGNDDKYFLGLYLEQGLSLEELKFALKVSRGAVDMRKSRILARLRDCFVFKGYPAFVQITRRDVTR